jgi:hypothetical protein
VVSSGGSGFAGQNAIVISPDAANDRQIELIFKAIKPDGTYVNSKDFKLNTVSLEIHSTVGFRLKFVNHSTEQPANLRDQLHRKF